MLALRTQQLNVSAAALRRLVCTEFELLEACQDAAALSEDAESFARLLARRSASQVHIFDLESLLMELGERPVSYSGCLRHSMRTLSDSPPQQALQRVLGEYERLLARGDLPPAVRDVLDGNYEAHLRLR